MANQRIIVNESYQTGYTYELADPMGQHFDGTFTPNLTAKEMLSLGIFGGNYFSEIPKEFPADCFKEV